MSIKPLTYRKHVFQQQCNPIFGIHHMKRGKQPVARTSTAAEAAPAAKLVRVNSRRSTPIADRADMFNASHNSSLDSSPEGLVYSPGWTNARVESNRESTEHRPRRRDDIPRPDPADRPLSIVQRAYAHRRAYAQGRVLPANLRPAEQHYRSNREQRGPAALQPAHARAVGETASQAGSATAQRAVRAESVDVLVERDRDRLAFRDCSNLKKLHLSGNELTTVPDAPRDLALLKTLDHGENRSRLYNSSFRNVDSLTGS
ncbi:hypothetical protein K0M31_001869 [Melipona bicolor]|uniref:Uncharacterized protein n=1 Tax=Melipona bicolor TaxID=60889 RepID=A0AA40KYJ7_9HYME|nr:hypothetical protein K0M31_001869 [Melipona bicolor]